MTKSNIMITVVIIAITVVMITRHGKLELVIGNIVMPVVMPFQIESTHKRKHNIVEDNILV